MTVFAVGMAMADFFFSGFAFSLDQLIWPARGLAYAFPATYGIELLQDEMLRGVTRSPGLLGVLAGGAVVAFLASWLLMRRELSPR